MCTCEFICELGGVCSTNMHLHNWKEGKKMKKWWELKLERESGRDDGKAYAEQAHVNVWRYKVWQWTSRKRRVVSMKSVRCKRSVQVRVYNPATLNAKECLNEKDINI